MSQSGHENAFTVEQKQKLQHIVEFFKLDAKPRARA